MLNMARSMTILAFPTARPRQNKDEKIWQRLHSCAIEDTPPLGHLLKHAAGPTSNLGRSLSVFDPIWGSKPPPALLGQKRKKGEN